MRLRSVTLGLALGLTGTAVVVAIAAAKGDSYVDGATLSGGPLAGPITVSFTLPDSYDDMSEAAPSSAQAAGVPAGWYDITFHYDFNETGHGRRTWQGKYDGVDSLYFPEDMVVGSGTWASGWYRANPMLADELHRALPSTAPAAGSGSLPAGESDQRSTTAGLVLLALGSVGVLLSRVRR